jgi:HPt (histidine-containing phosphotransfer) domain-containing protein
VRKSDNTTILDREQLRDITLDDTELMREIVSALIDDTARQLAPLQKAISEQDSEACIRLAHYSKGACANVGANSAAAVLKRIETDAARRQFAECGSSLAVMMREIDLLRQESCKL